MPQLPEQWPDPWDVQLFDCIIQTHYPNMPWGEPTTIYQFPLGARYACRLCIAREGLKGAEVALLPTSAEEVKQHIKEYHVIHQQACDPSSN
jgi:hypothetical protein